MEIENMIEKQKTSNRIFIYSLAIYLILLPLGVMQLPASLGSLLKYIAIIPVIVWICKSRVIKIWKDRLFISQLIFVAWLFFTILWSVDAMTSISRCITQFLFIFLLLPTTSYIFSQEDIKILKNSLVWSSRITLLITVLNSSFVEGRLYLSGIITEDPNYLCGYFIFGVVCCVEKIMSSEKLFKKFISLIELMLYLYAVFATGSRGGLFAILGSAVLYIIFANNKGKKAKDIFKKAIIVVILLSSIIIITNHLPEKIMNRFLWSTIKESDGTGRYELWENGLHVYSQNGLLKQLFGSGTGTIRTYMAQNGYADQVMHNIFVEVLIESGVVGIILYVIAILRFVLFSFKENNKFAFSILCGLIILSLSTSLYAFKPYWNILVFILCLSSQKRSKDVI